MRSLALAQLPLTELPTTTRPLVPLKHARNKLVTTTLREVRTPNVGKPPVLAATRPLRPRQPARLSNLPKQDVYALSGADLRRREVMLPFGLTPATTRVTATLLKRLVRAASGEQLLKKVGSAWVFVPNQELIDLTDESVEYRLGRLSILS